jgi:Flp pilus assembly pilin Flp
LITTPTLPAVQFNIYYLGLDLLGLPLCGGKLMAIYRAQTRMRKRNNKGQGMAEYAGVIAFIALLVAMTFGFARGSLLPSVSGAYSTVESHVTQLSTAGGSAS